MTTLRHHSPTRRAALKRQCNALWSKAIHATTDGTCALCSNTYGLQAAHLIGKGSNPTQRYDLLNGLPLCPACHDALDGRDMQGQWSAWQELRAKWPEQWRYVQGNRHKVLPRLADYELSELRDQLSTVDSSTQEGL